MTYIPLCSNISERIRSEMFASLDPNQLYWINTDIGVGDKLLSIVEGNENKIKPELLKEFDRIYRPKPIEIEDDDLPF